MSDNATIIGGKNIPCFAPVSTWHEHGIEFIAGQGHNKRRLQDIDLVVWHTTGGEGRPSTMAATLTRRKLGIEFAIDRNGLIWQFCDPLAVDTADAGAVNPRSVGVEIVNYLYRRKRSDIPRSGRNRPIYETAIRGRPIKLAHCTPAQISASIALAESLSTGLRIPRLVPMDGDFFVSQRTLEPGEIESFTGHLGHFHLSKNKIDPGFDVLEALRASWAPLL
jgi:hypothetical protein